MEIHDLLARLEEEAAWEGVPILRSQERGLLIGAAAKAAPRRILEVGTAIGYSALLLSSYFPSAQIDTIEIDEARYHRARRAVASAGREDRIRCHLGDAADILPRLSGRYDFFYLDGPKGQYLRYLRMAEPLLAKRAVIAADNVLFRGLVEGPDPVPHRYRTIVMRLRAYIAYVKEHYDTVICPEGDGLAISRRRTGMTETKRKEERNPQTPAPAE